MAKSDKIIKCFGHFWRRDLIDWDRRGAGIYGTSKKDSDEYEIDARDQVGAYVLFDQLRRPLYIGQVGSGQTTQRNLFVRLKEHNSGELADRWSHFSWFGLLDFQENGKVSYRYRRRVGSVSYGVALSQLEAVLMLVVEPPFNRQGPQWADATRYYQWSGYEDVTLEDIFTELREIREQLE